MGKEMTIENALMNHDRLAEENKRLREFVKKAAGLEIETFHFETQGGEEDYIEYICTDIVDDANDLLSEMEGELEGYLLKVTGKTSEQH